MVEPASVRERLLRDVVGLLTFFPGLDALGAELRSQHRARLTRRLTAELQAWLGAIKTHLETEDPTWRS